MCFDSRPVSHRRVCTALASVHPDTTPSHRTQSPRTSADRRWGRQARRQPGRANKAVRHRRAASCCRFNCSLQLS
eukprot:2472585-Prymnesium_polylepis.1